MATELTANIDGFQVRITRDEDEGGHFVGVRDSDSEDEEDWIWAKPYQWVDFGEWEMRTLLEQVEPAPKPEK